MTSNDENGAIWERPIFLDCFRLVMEFTIILVLTANPVKKETLLVTWTLHDLVAGFVFISLCISKETNKRNVIMRVIFGRSQGSWGYVIYGFVVGLLLGFGPKIYLIITRPTLSKAVTFLAYWYGGALIILPFVFLGIGVYLMHYVHHKKDNDLKPVIREFKRIFISQHKSVFIKVTCIFSVLVIIMSGILLVASSVSFTKCTLSDPCTDPFTSRIVACFLFCIIVACVGLSLSYSTSRMCKYDLIQDESNLTNLTQIKLNIFD